MRRQCLLSPFSGYRCSKLDRYYDSHSLLHGEMVKFSVKIKKIFGFCWNCLKSDCLSSLRGFEWFLIFFILFNHFNNSTNFKTSLTRQFQVHSLSTWIPLESLSNTFLKKFLWRQCLLSPLSRYCCSKVGRYYDPHSGLQGVTRLNGKRNIITGGQYYEQYTWEFFQQWKKERVTCPISTKIITLFKTKTKIPVQS